MRNVITTVTFCQEKFGEICFRGKIRGGAADQEIGFDMDGREL